MSDLLLTATIFALATWHISYAITNEDVFKWLRSFFGARVIEKQIEQFGQTVTINTIEQTGDYPLQRIMGALLSCLYCTSFWVAAVMWGFHMNGRTLVFMDFVMVMGISGLAILIHDWRSK